MVPQSDVSQRLEAHVRDKASLKSLHSLALSLRREIISGPEAVSNATAKALRTVISGARFSNLEELIEIIKSAGAFLQDSQPKEQTIGNITRRTLHLLREEARAAGLDQHAGRTVSSDQQSAIPSTSVSAIHSRQISTVTAESVDSSFASEALQRPANLSSFRPGSTFSISDLVAASSGVTPSSQAPSSFAASPIGSGQVTPSNWGNMSLDRLGYGVEMLQIRSNEKKQQQSKLLDNVEENDSSEVDEDEDDQINDKITKKSNAGIYQLKPLLIQAIQELVDELETVDINIAKDSRDHIHSGEIILTIGYSKTVETFLKTAAKNRKFTVIVAEGSPQFSGHTLAKSLSSIGITALLVPDSSTFALMPRISKVLLGTHCVLANGGLLAVPGTRILAEAANAHSTPTVVLAGVYKVCPDWTWVGIGTSLVDRKQGSFVKGICGSYKSDIGNNFSAELNPMDIAKINGKDLQMTSSSTLFFNSTWDYIEPEMTTLLITNVGEHPISLVYRLLDEHYDVQDTLL